MACFTRSNAALIGLFVLPVNRPAKPTTRHARCGWALKGHQGRSTGRIMSSARSLWPSFAHNLAVSQGEAVKMPPLVGDSISQSSFMRRNHLEYTSYSPCVWTWLVCIHDKLWMKLTRSSCHSQVCFHYDIFSVCSDCRFQSKARIWSWTKCVDA